MMSTYLVPLFLFLLSVQGHTVITYPGWRGMNLITNATFPFGMQWMYPCGGIGVTANRTTWPIDGGAVAVQPGWFRGHSTALMYINLGLGADPSNYSMPMVPMFEVTGPAGDNPYPGQFCVPSVPLPQGVSPKNGDLASIQVVELAKHGAGMYSCVDIIFTDDMSQVAPVNETNCYNSSDLRVDAVKVVRDSEVSSVCTVADASETTGDIWGTASATSNRSSLFPTGPTNNSSSGHTVKSDLPLGFFVLLGSLLLL
ncbi:hypothetical protein QBC46DRAFT_378999 [Diplogelasinospora grovesii]|uniref:Copper acquisition factor BIM1-like domain-containing protein n=1 Tax=Diplogelasinospora grovesii TaxID=303347 RepID=A0AAN6NBU5_9PEZI|nr:hypothetical protein QBC46DRAFT_378999 [Diplogelasinospora grovesii]